MLTRSFCLVSVFFMMQKVSEALVICTYSHSIFLYIKIVVKLKHGQYTVFTSTLLRVTSTNSRKYLVHSSVQHNSKFSLNLPAQASPRVNLIQIFGMHSIVL